MKSSFWIGTSGYVGQEWCAGFYPDQLPEHRHLEFYSEHFSAVQVRLGDAPDPDLIARLREASPESLRIGFQVHLTLGERTLAAGFDLAAMERLTGLGSRLGPVQFTIPDGFPCVMSRLEEFLDRLSPGLVYALEFPRTEWYTERVRGALEARDMSFVIHDHPGRVAPWWITAPTLIVKRCGSGRRGDGKYTSDEVKKLSEHLEEHLHTGKHVHVIFDNHAGGACLDNARELRRLLTV